MKSDKLKEVVDFAIEKEQEAVDFYTGLADRVKEKAIADELRKMARVEETHRDRLKNMDVEGYSVGVVRPVVDLKIADYLVEKEPTPDMTWQDLVQIAMKRELSSVRLYTDLAKLAADPQAKNLFENLTAEEGAHKLFFEKIWDEEVLMWN